MFVSIAYSEKSRQENNIAVEAAPAVTSCPCNRYLTYIRMLFWVRRQIVHNTRHQNVNKDISKLLDTYA